jgi:glycosyltransferase involved in cell wall biosynthesis
VPVNYGGAIDIFYKIKALYEKGVKIHLHCFEYDRKPAAILDEMCETVQYYKRDISKTKLLSIKPYIVVSRSDNELLKNLLKDHAPILFEGLHSCFFLDNPKLKNRRKIVRTHNIEHDYYSNLAKIEKDIFRRTYFKSEATKLKRFEKILEIADSIAAISKNDREHLRRKFNNVITVSAFHPHKLVEIDQQISDFALYHGSLDVGENNEAALFLVNEVFNDINVKFCIAGNKPSKELQEAVNKNPNISLLSGVDSEKIYEIISKAQINILTTQQNTGIKLKLLAALYKGKHCIVNSPMVEKTGLEELCVIRNSAADIKESIKTLITSPFTDEEQEKRKKILQNGKFSNEYNTDKLLEMVFA